MVLSNDMKKAIAFGLICGAIISILSVFGYCSEEEILTVNVASNLAINSSTGVFQNSDSLNVYYVEMEPGYVYKITNSSSASRRVGLANSVSLGSSVYSYALLGRNESYSVNGSTSYLYVVGASTDSTSLVFTREKLEGLTNFVDNVAYSLSYGNLSGVFDKAVPILAISVLFGFGFYLIRRIINKSKKAKGGV